MPLALLTVVGLLGLIFYVVHRVKPKRFKLSAELWKLKLNVEVDSEPDAENLPGDKHEALPKG